MYKQQYYKKFGISEQVIKFSEEIISSIQNNFNKIDKIAENNQCKILSAMQEEHVDLDCFKSSSGYGYNDYGRDILERVYSNVFHTEAALVRPSITCGTHALAIVFNGLLRPGQTLFSPAGHPYDTLEEVIGIRNSIGSLAEYDIKYKEVPLNNDYSFDYNEISYALRDTSIKVATIQRSRGYQLRNSFHVNEIGNLIDFIKNKRSDINIVVDNCYGEFVDVIEPSDVGADIIVGSLIKNPGGGLAPIGGYIAGAKHLVEKCAFRMNAPGLGSEVGASLNVLKDFYQGFFLSPIVVSAALKTVIFAAAAYENLGFCVMPAADDKRSDIIEAIIFNRSDGLISFCKGIQYASPVDSHVTPEPCHMPGYDDKVIMASGAFVQGSSIELSSDGPIRPPYVAFLQGGLTWPHGKIGIMKSIQQLIDDNVISL